MKHKRILFLTLRIFSATGGIEKVCRIFGKALFEMTFSGNCCFEIYSSHDTTNQSNDNAYFPSDSFLGFGNNRFEFLNAAFLKGVKSDVVILSHINLLPIGWLIKRFSPKTKLVMLAHGIEVWSLPLGIKKNMLNACDDILCVSQFTKDEMIKLHGDVAKKYSVLNNCLDPFLPVLAERKDSFDLRSKYGLAPFDKILFTLTRMDATERYKGYDRVLQAMALLIKNMPNLKYIIGGSYDAFEKKKIDELIIELGLKDNVIITGFIPDENLKDYFQMSDVYVMPSYNEGFGIVFIEAMYFGLPVIAGNKDGSVDALLNGKLGTLIDPMDIEALKNAIEDNFENTNKGVVNKDVLMEYFGYEGYKEKMEKFVFN
jgi:glycosyltransferase involved in cell wall biosynthesis